MADSTHIHFQCPHCRGVLIAGSQSLTCAVCSTSYARRNGIWDFRCRRYDYYFNPVPRAEMDNIVRNAATVPWDETIRSFLRFVRNVPSWIDNIAVNGRYTWKIFLELGEGSRFLDLGCGLGNLSSNIAPHVAEMVALDLTWERLQFAQQRFKQFNRDSRITVVAGGDGHFLPFPDGHFDCIALSGVLEWIADDPTLFEGDGGRFAKAIRMLRSVFGSANPRRTQRRFLEELRRILKPDGQLFVAIENRLNHEYFLGRPDHHSGLKFGSLLPRYIANAYSVARARRPYRTYTYSSGGLKRLFGSAGLRNSSILGLTPGYSNLGEIIPYKSHWRFWIPSNVSGWASRVRRSQMFVPALGIIGQNGINRRQPLLGRLAAEIDRSRVLPGNMRLSDCRVTGKDKAVLRGRIGASAVILKLPTGARGKRGEDNNRATLADLASIPGVSSHVPEPLVTGAIEGLSYYLERAMPGAAITPRPTPVEVARAIAHAYEFLFSLHESLQSHSAIATEENLTLLITEPVMALKSAGFDPVQCDAVRCRLGEELMKFRWQLGLQHGDFTNSNVLWSNGVLSGVIDWEYANRHGLPLLDSIAYLESIRRLEQPGSVASETLRRLARWDWTSSEATDPLMMLYRKFDVDPARHRLLCQIWWLQHIGHRLETTARFEARLINEEVRPALLEMSTNAW